MLNETFYNLSSKGKKYTLDQVIEEMIKFIDQEPDKKYKVMVGTDSKHLPHETTFATIIAIHKVGRGARFWYARKKQVHERNLCTRIMREAVDSVEIMNRLYDSNLVFRIDEEDFSIHVDAGNNGDSRRIVNECIGYVIGAGYNCEAKPDSPIAVNIADKFTK